MVYDAFRQDGLPTYYLPNQTAVTADVLIFGFVFAFLAVAFTLLVILPGVRGWQRLYFFIQFVVSLFIGASILLSNFGQSWAVALIPNVTTAYRAGRPGDIQANIGVHIGLRAVNVTLKGLPEEQEGESPAAGERIDYNERFHFDGPQGRAGFGRYAGRINREFRTAQYRGLPFPILWVAEYFTLDGEDIRWGRSYRLAGFYAAILLWLSFPLWLLSNILLVAGVLSDGFTLLVTTGCCMLGANILYAFIRHGSTLLSIPFSNEHVLMFSYGWSFYLCLVGGIVAFSVGVVCLVMEFFFPEEMGVVFGQPAEPESQIEYYHHKQRSAGHVRKTWFATVDTATQRLHGHKENDARQKRNRRRTWADLVDQARRFRNVQRDGHVLARRNTCWAE